MCVIMQELCEKQHVGSSCAYLVSMHVQVLSNILYRSEISVWAKLSLVAEIVVIVAIYLYYGENIEEPLMNFIQVKQLRRKTVPQINQSRYV